MTTTLESLITELEKALAIETDASTRLVKLRDERQQLLYVLMRRELEALDGEARIINIPLAEMNARTSAEGQDSFEEVLEAEHAMRKAHDAVEVIRARLQAYKG